MSQRNCIHASNQRGEIVTCAIEALGPGIKQVGPYACLMVCKKRVPIPGVVDVPYEELFASGKRLSPAKTQDGATSDDICLGCLYGDNPPPAEA